MSLVNGIQVREESLWFGEGEQTFFGRVTLPVGQESRGGVLMSSPIGRESRLARRALRSLAIFLATDGFVSLRFDHYGSGDSSGTVDDHMLGRALIDGVVQGAALLRTFDLTSISAVGMRMGATILGEATSSHDLSLSSLVLWDPCETGQSYLRELHALGAMRPKALKVDSRNQDKMLEYPIGEETAAQISKFSLREPEEQPPAERILIVVRDDRPVSDKFRKRWDTTNVEWRTTSEQGPLLETQLPTSVQPTTTIADIRSWLAAPEPLNTPYSMAPRTHAAKIQVGPSGMLVRETALELSEQSMFGVVSEPLGGSKGPLIVFVNGINEDHVGPARLWVELSRRWSNLGLRCLRFDLSELGESPWVPGQPERPIFDRSRSVDVANSVRALLPDDTTELVLVAYCSGAQLALDAAQELNPIGVCVINPQLAAGVFENVDRVMNSSHKGIQKFVHHIESFLQRYRRVDDLVRRASRFVVSFAYPPDIGSVLDQAHSSVLLLISPEDLPRFQSIPILRRRLVSSGNVRVEKIPEMDHAILSTLGRQRAVELLNEHIVDKYVGAM